MVIIGMAYHYANLFGSCLGAPLVTRMANEPDEWTVLRKVYNV